MATTLDHRMQSITKLIHWLDTFSLFPSGDTPAEYALLDKIISEAHIYNPWFIEQFNRAALADFSSWLKNNIIDLSNVSRSIENTAKENKVVLLLPPNVPLSGAKELIVLCLAGYKTILHNKDHKDDLLQCLTQQLLSFNPEMRELIQWTDFYPSGIDGWIIYDKPDQKAIHQYFEKRNSLFIPDAKQSVVLNGTENEEKLSKIADCIFIYWGFSRSNIRKVYVPLGYDFNKFFEALERYNFLYHHNCYANNYDYHKSVLLMNRIPFLDNGFILLREDTSDNVPISCLHYSYYSTEGERDELSRLAVERENKSGHQNIDLLIHFIKSFKKDLH